jgi:hypothetical protein
VNNLRSHYTNPRFDGLPWAVDETRGGKQRREARQMNNRAEDTATKILLLFESGGVAPLEPEKFAQVREHVRSILARAMENKDEKKRRKWTGFQRAMAERQ